MIHNYYNATSTMLERYELKFIIPLFMIEPIFEYVSIYCNLDKYSEKSLDNFIRLIAYILILQIIFF